MNIKTLGHAIWYAQSHNASFKENKEGGYQNISAVVSPSGYSNSICFQIYGCITEVIRRVTQICRSENSTDQQNSCVFQ
jgi:hypothetical protein